jgi:uncharacterized protein YukE
MSPASLLDPIAALGGPARPSGDPGAVRAAAQRLAGAADELDRLSTRTGAVIGQARSAWSGMASDAFAATGGQLRTGAATDADTLRAAAGALAAYAARLEAAQSAWSSASTRAESAVALNPATTPEDLRAFATQATEADADAQAAATQLAAELNALTPTGPDPAASLTFGQTLGLVAGVPNPLNLLDRIPKAYEDLLKHALLDPMNLATGFISTKAGYAAHRAFNQFSAAAGSYRETVLAYFGRHGAGPSLGAFRIRETWLADLSNWMPVDRAAKAADVVEQSFREANLGLLLREADRLGDAAAGMRGLRAAGDFLGPVGMVFDLQTLTAPSKDEGAREFADRGFAALSFAGGAVGVAAMIGITVLPPVAIAAGVVTAGAALWSLGSLAYDNRKEIAQFMVNAHDAADQFLQDRVRDGGRIFESGGTELVEAGNAVRDFGGVADAQIDAVGGQVASRTDHLADRLGSTADKLRDAGRGSPVGIIRTEQAAVAIDVAAGAIRGGGQVAAVAADIGGNVVQATSAGIGQGLESAGRTAQSVGEGIQKGAGAGADVVLSFLGVKS